MPKCCIMPNNLKKNCNRTHLPVQYSGRWGELSTVYQCIRINVRKLEKTCLPRVEEGGLGVRTLWEILGWVLTAQLCCSLHIHITFNNLPTLALEGNLSVSLTYSLCFQPVQREQYWKNPQCVFAVVSLGPAITAHPPYLTLYLSSLCVESVYVG